MCDTLDDGVAFPRPDYSLTCSGSQHGAYVVFAGSMVFVYPIDVPMFLLVLDALAQCGA